MSEVQEPCAGDALQGHLQGLCLRSTAVPCEPEKRGLWGGAKSRWLVPGRPPMGAQSAALHVPPGSGWLPSGRLGSAADCPRTSRRRAAGCLAWASRTAGCGGTGTGTTLGGGGRCVWEVPGEGTRRRGEPEGLGGQGCLREGHSGVAGLALGPHLLPRAGLSSPERLSLKAPGSVWPRAQSPASPNAPH